MTPEQFKLYSTLPPEKRDYDLNKAIVDCLATEEGRQDYFYWILQNDVVFATAYKASTDFLPIEDQTQRNISTLMLVFIHQFLAQHLLQQQS